MLCPRSCHRPSRQSRPVQYHLQHRCIPVTQIPHLPGWQGQSQLAQVRVTARKERWTLITSRSNVNGERSRECMCIDTEGYSYTLSATFDVLRWRVRAWGGTAVVVTEHTPTYSPARLVDHVNAICPFLHSASRASPNCLVRAFAFCSAAAAVSSRESQADVVRNVCGETYSWILIRCSFACWIGSVACRRRVW